MPSRKKKSVSKTPSRIGTTKKIPKRTSQEEGKATCSRANNFKNGKDVSFRLSLVAMVRLRHQLAYASRLRAYLKSVALPMASVPGLKDM